MLYKAQVVKNQIFIWLFSPMADITHILVVDDDTRIRDLLSQYLTEHGFFVSAAKDANDVYALIKYYVFDVMIVDVMMPGETGVELTQSLRKEMDVPIIMLTAMGEAEHRITGLESGADDYMPKPFEPKELLLRIHSILKRTRAKQRDAVTFGKLRFSITNKVLRKAGQVIMLSTKEEELLAALAARIGEMVTRTELAQLCGGVNERSIDVQVTRLRNKIEDNPKQPRLLKTVRGQGYMLQGNI